MEISTYKKLSLFALLLVGSLGFFGIFSPKAEAVVTGTFPRDNNWVLLSKYNCPGHCLDTPSASFRVFYDTKSNAYQNNNNFAVTIQVICRGGTSKPGGGMKFGNNGRKDWNHCNGALSTSPNYSISQTVGKGQMNNAKNINLTDRYRYVDLDTRVGSSSADIIAIIVTANNGGRVTFEEVSRGEINQPYEGNSNNYTGHGSGSQRGPYPIGTAFAMFQNTGGSYSRSFDLEFAADCNITKNTSVKLRWYDADKNTGTNPHDLKFDLYDKTAGSYVRQNYESNLGGNDSYRHITFTVKPDHKYKWTWKGVSNTNGIQIWMPFSEFTSDVSCDKPPTGNLTLRCSSNGIRTTGLGDADSSNGATSIRVRVKQGGSWIKVYDSEDAGKTRRKGNHNFNWPSSYPKNGNNTVELRVRNITPDNEMNGDGAKTITKTINCGSEAPGDLTCDKITIKQGTVNNWTNGDNGENYRFILWVANTPFGDGQSPGKNEEGRAKSSQTWTAIRPGSGWDNLVYNFSAGGPYNLSRSGHIYVQVRVYQYDGSGSKTNWDNWALRATHREGKGPCYVASCSIDVEENVDGSSDGQNSVMANKPFNITVTLTNEGVNIWRHGAGLWPESGHSWNWWPYTAPGEEVWLGESIDLDATLWAPNNQAGNHFKYKSYTSGVDPMKRPNGSSLFCETSVNTYKEFILEPQINQPPSFEYNGNPDVEEPDMVVLNTSISNTAENPATVSVPVTRQLTKNGSTYPPSPWTSPYSLGSTSIRDTAPVSSSEFGDVYCGEISVAPAAGWEGPGGHRYITNPSDSDGGQCSYIANRPYLRAYGADVTAGSNFVGTNGECNGNPAGGIKGYLSGRPTKSGAGSQLAAIALNTIESFRTASLRTSDPDAPNGLSFGNSLSPNGHYSGISICSTDFYGKTQADEGDKKNVINSGALSPSSWPDYDQTLYDGNLVLNGTGGTPFGGKKVIYVNGNVTIENNIVLDGFGDPTKAPNFTLVASGNIYISKNVSRLDGLYVSQQKGDGSGGTIYTCSRPGAFDQYEAGPTDDSGHNELLDNCYSGAQLTVNGAFIAHKVEFLRIYKSVRESRQDHLETADVTNAAEVFNYSPALYLSPPPFVSDSKSHFDLQHYTTLPPVL